jgi:hypothetical protein
MSAEQWWNDDDEGKTEEARRKDYQNVISSNTNLT